MCEGCVYCEGDCFMGLRPVRLYPPPPQIYDSIDADGEPNNKVSLPEKLAVLEFSSIIGQRNSPGEFFQLKSLCVFASALSSEIISGMCSAYVYQARHW